MVGKLKDVEIAFQAELYMPSLVVKAGRFSHLIVIFPTSAKYDPVKLLPFSATLVNRGQKIKHSLKIIHQIISNAT